MIVNALLEILLIVLAFFVYIKLSSIGNPTYSVSLNDEFTYCDCYGQIYKQSSTCDPNIFEKNCTGSACGVVASCTFKSIESPSYVGFFKTFTIFETLWLTLFLSAFAEMVLAGLYGIWYWTFNKDNVPSSAFFQSLHKTVR